MMTKWEILSNMQPELVHLTYADGQEFNVLKTDFDRAFGTMVNASGDIIRKEFEVK